MMPGAATPVALSASTRVALQANALTVHAGERQLVANLTAAFRSGELTAVLGRNGSGKTMTLHTLAGLRAPHAGSVLLDGMPLTRLRRRAIARRLGVLTQDLEEAFTASVLETVLLGRHPHLPLWHWESAADEQIARESLSRVAMESFASRRMETLSGGEQRRVATAALLAQDPHVFLLDEPTNHLDPHHQLSVLALFRELANGGRTVIATLHDPTLAARFADRAVLLFGDGKWMSGAIDEVLTRESLSELYRTPVVETVVNGRRVFVNA